MGLLYGLHQLHGRPARTSTTFRTNFSESTQLCPQRRCDGINQGSIVPFEEASEKLGLQYSVSASSLFIYISLIDFLKMDDTRGAALFGRPPAGALQY